MVIRRSRPAFKPEDYGLTSYVSELVTSACQVALVGDTDELPPVSIEMAARQEHINARAFRDEAAALRWLSNAIGPVRRYRFTRVVIAGAPDEQGIYALWDGEEVIYYGRGPIRTRLRDYFYGRVDELTRRATHYGWELCKDPGGARSRAARRAPPRIDVRRGLTPRHSFRLFLARTVGGTRRPAFPRPPRGRRCRK